MKKLVFCLTSIGLLFTSCFVKAQIYTIGVRGGISVPNLTAGSGNNNPLNTGYSSRLGPDAGVFLGFKISKYFMVQPMLEYSSQGGKKNGLQAFTTPVELAAMFPPGQSPAYLYANYKSEAKLNYMLLPILARYGVNVKKKSPLSVYIDAGPFVGLLISAKQLTRGQSQFYSDPAGRQPLPGGPQSFNSTDNIKSQLHRINFGIEGNLGLNYRLHDNNIFIEGGGNYGFLNIQKGTQNGKNNTGAATATIGYSRWIY